MKAGRSLLHYRILGKLGQGGMGVVYRATDTRLGREVALKLLPEGMAARPEGLERFRREARAVAALNHPHIVTIYSVDEAPGESDTEPLRFLTMELIEGESLDALIPAGGMPTDRLLDLAGQLADALSAAHEKGVIHRDLKPGNLMVTGAGQLKILDFGLAKLSEPPSDPGLVTSAPTEVVTREGVVVGTVPYMSPEQLAGRTLDARSDLFSVGTILYEMACGARPFQGESSAELASAILRDPAPALSEVRPDLAAALCELVHRCLEKDPDRRFPSARALQEALAEVRTGPAAPPASAAAAPGRAFVGRERERQEILAVMDAARSGRGGMVLLGGEPGVGKTRLAERLLADAESRGMLALKGHAYEDEGAPYVTSLEILEEMTRLLPPDRLREMLGENASEIARLMPELRRRFPDIPEPLDLPPEQQRRYLFNSVLEFLERATRDAPMVMLLDDLHWADESSLLLLEHLAPHLERLPLLFIGTYRDVELDVGRPFARMRADLVRGQLARRILVRRFESDDVRHLLAALGGPDPPDPLVQAIFRETEGNPFFVTEVFEHLAEEGALFDDEGAWKPDLDVASLEVPEGVRLVIGRRLERLDPATPKILATAAIIGLRFDLEVLEGAVRGAPDAVLDALDEAEAARLVATVPGRRDARYEFVHALVRQTLLGTLSVPRRQRGHLRVAEAMEKTWGVRAEEHAGDIAHHLYQSGAAADPDLTRRYLVLAAQQGLKAASAEEALTLVERALDLDDEISPGEEGRLLRLRGQAYRTLGRWPEAARDWEAALPLLEAAGAGDVVADICESLAHQRLWANRVDEARTLGQRGLAAVGDEPGSARCRLLAVLGHTSGNGGNYDQAERLINEAMAMAEELGDERLQGWVLMARMYLCEHWLGLRRQAETGRRALELVRRAGTPWELCGVMGAAVFGSLGHGEVDRAEALVDELRGLSLRQGHNGGEIHVLYSDAMIRLWRGDLPGSWEAMASAIQRSLEMEMPWVSLLYACKGTTAFMRNEVEAARALFEEALSRRLPLTFTGVEPAYLMRSLAYMGEDGAAALAAELAERLPRPGEENPIGAWHVGLATIETAVLLGEPERAAHLYPVPRQLAEDNGAVACWGLGLTERFSGIAAAAGQNWSAAEGHFRKALGQAEDLPHRLERPEVLRWHAWMLRQQGGAAERADAMLRQAQEEFAALGVRGPWTRFPD